jgi:pimeloyl-ACP methyl ester carboxylesterase
MRFLPALILALPLLLTPNVAASQDQRTTVQVPAGPNVPAGVTIHYSTPPHVYPIVILFAGNGGVLSLAKRGWATELQGNFLIRSRHHFLANDLQVVLIDAPSNHAGPSGLNGQRLTAEHAEVVAAVIAEVRKAYPKRPVWLAGTSAGTLSVANAAVRLAGTSRGPDGIVLTSSITVQQPADVEPNAVLQAHLTAITVPTYVAWHRDDACTRTPGTAAGGHPQAVFASLSGVAASDKDWKEFTGGGNVGNACDAFAYHGFNGIEDDVVRNIAAFIKKHTPQP